MLIKAIHSHLGRFERKHFDSPAAEESSSHGLYFRHGVLPSNLILASLRAMPFFFFFKAHLKGCWEATDVGPLAASQGSSHLPAREPRDATGKRVSPSGPAHQTQQRVAKWLMRGSVEQALEGNL